MTVQNKSIIDRNVIELRQEDYDDGVATFVVTFDNGVTLKETYEMCNLTASDGSTRMTAGDLIDYLEVAGEPTLRYKLIRGLGVCTSSQIINGDEETPQDPVEVEGDGGVANESIDDSVEWKALLNTHLTQNNVHAAIELSSNVCSTYGKDSAKDVISLVSIGNNEAAYHAMSVAYSYLAANAIAYAVGNEEMLFGEGLPSVPSADKEGKIYKAAEKLVTKYKQGKYKSHDDLKDDAEALDEALDEDEPSCGDVIIGAFGMLFSCPKETDDIEEMLKHVIKKGTDAEQTQAKRILDAIEDYSIVEDIPMCSYMFDNYDKDLEKDMIEACKLVTDGKSDDDKGKIKFGMGKEAERKFKEAENLTAFDYYCMALIFEHSDTDAVSNDAIEAGIKLAKKQDCILDEMQFELLKKEIS